jgi:integrase/recombinase XerC
MELFYSSGLRLSELVSLNLGDIDLAGGELRVTGKGNKTRLLPVGRYAVKAIETWLMIRQGLANEDEKALFVSKQGKRLAARSVEKRLRGWAVKQGLGRNVHPHMLRHSFASHMLESSGDLRAVQELLGHQNISTTQIYTHLDFQHLARVFDDAHPRARRKKTSS